MRTSEFDEYLYEQLRDDEFAAEFLSASLEDGSLADFLNALRKFIDARGGIGELAEAVKLNRQSLYKSINEEGNPLMGSILEIFNRMDFRFCVMPPQDECDNKEAT